ncbi:MAG: O-succinylhomoserine sulfhydrylase [Rhodospirillales bacterium]|nr:O-succinylhomoserine sulfhydrylase [Rhodospirillales bacterium]
MSVKPKKAWRKATRLVRGGLTRSGFEETSEALFLTSGFVYGSPQEAEEAFKGDSNRYIYSRLGNPTVAMFEERLALLEGAAFCIGTASGMAAMYAAIISQVRAGDRIVASRALFGSCSYILTDHLPRYGIETVLVDGTDLTQWRHALSRPTTCVFLESPSNPTLEVIDIAAVSRLAHGAGARVVVDNVFASAILQNPLDLGADVVVYSATKHIDGQGRTMGGAILFNDEAFLSDHLEPFFRHTGPSLSPFNAWVLLKGLETMELRVEKQCDNALRVAEFLSDQPRICKVIYPGLASHPQHELAMRQMGRGGTLVTFELDGGQKAAFPFLEALELVDISNNLGDTKSLITHPTTTTQQSMAEEARLHLGITPGLVRLSVGLEDAQDIIEDLEQALLRIG